MNEESLREQQETRQARRSEVSEPVFLVPAPSSVRLVQLQEPLDEIEAASADPALLLWMLALLFFGLGDTISSFLVFSKGGSEANPVMALALSLPGFLKGLLGFVLVKTVAMTVLYAVAYFWEGAHRWIIPLLMVVAGVYLTTRNAMVFLGL